MEQIFNPILNGALSVIGGLIPLSITLYIVFIWARSNFQNIISKENELIKAHQDYISQNHKYLKELRDGVNAGNIEYNKEVQQAMSHYQSEMVKTHNFVILKKIWIKRIEDATFLNWLGYYFSKNYFSDYFKYDNPENES